MNRAGESGWSEVTTVNVPGPSAPAAASSASAPSSSSAGASTADPKRAAEARLARLVREIETALAANSGRARLERAVATARAEQPQLQAQLAPADMERLAAALQRAQAALRALNREAERAQLLAKLQERVRGDEEAWQALRARAQEFARAEPDPHTRVRFENELRRLSGEREAHLQRMRQKEEARAQLQVRTAAPALACSRCLFTVPQDAMAARDTEALARAIDMAKRAGVVCLHASLLSLFPVRVRCGLSLRFRPRNRQPNFSLNSRNHQNCRMPRPPPHLSLRRNRNRNRNRSLRNRLRALWRLRVRLSRKTLKDRVRLLPHNLPSQLWTKRRFCSESCNCRPPSTSESSANLKLPSMLRLAVCVISSSSSKDSATSTTSSDIALNRRGSRRNTGRQTGAGGVRWALAMPRAWSAGAETGAAGAYEASGSRPPAPPVRWSRRRRTRLHGPWRTTTAIPDSRATITPAVRTTLTKTPAPSPAVTTPFHPSHNRSRSRRYRKIAAPQSTRPKRCSWTALG